MNASISSSDLVHTAYRLLKQDTYYDKMDLFLRANVAACETNGSIQKPQDTLTAIVDELCKRALSPKSQRVIKAWLKQVYATIIAVARKIPDKILDEDKKLPMSCDQAVTRTGGEV